MPQKFYVYLLESLSISGLTYVGFTGRSVDTRLREHNLKKSKTKYTNRGRPWKLHCYVTFKTRKVAFLFERKMKYQRNKQGKYTFKETRKRYLGLEGKVKKFRELCEEENAEIMFQ